MEEMEKNFIHDIIDEDLRENPNLKIHTRFPPETNGYLHIGSAKVIMINYQTAKKYGGLFNLRYDDTDPARADIEYVEAIYRDMCWLGATPSGGIFYGSDYFDKCYEFAVRLIKDGKAYVCDLTDDEMREYRGALTKPGKNPPYRDRSVEGKEEFFEFSNNPQNPDAGTRKVVFTCELFIDADDFAEDPPPGSFRFKPGGEVRLMGAYIICCNGIMKNPDGSIKELHCTADLETGSGTPAESRKVKDTVHWLSARYAVEITLMLYDKLFVIENVNDIPEGQTCNDYLNPDSLVRLEHCYAEPCLKDAKTGEQFQFVRVGYFCKDTKYSDTFNRIVGLK